MGQGQAVSRHAPPSIWVWLAVVAGAVLGTALACGAWYVGP